MERQPALRPRCNWTSSPVAATIPYFRCFHCRHLGVPPYGCCDGKRRTATTRTTSVPTRGDDIAQSRATGDLRGGAYWRRSFSSPIRLEVCWITGRSGRLLCCRTKEQRQIMRNHTRQKGDHDSHRIKGSSEGHPGLLAWRCGR